MPDSSLRFPLEGGATPDPGQLLQDTLKEFTDDLVPYLMAGLGQLVVAIPVTIALIFGMYFLMFGTMIGGMLVGGAIGAFVGNIAGEDAGALVFLIVYMLTFVLMFALIIGLSAFVGAVMAPLNASLLRRIAMHQRGERVLDFSAAFSHATQNLVSTILVTALVGLLVSIGFMLCYIPGIIAAFVLMYAGSLVYLHGVSPVTAVKTSVQRFLADLPFHGVYSLLHFAVGIAAAWVPLLGPMFLVALHVRAHRTLFGDGETAVL